MRDIEKIMARITPLQDVLDEEKPLQIKRGMHEIMRCLELYHFKVENFKGEPCIYKRYPDCEVAGIGMNHDTLHGEQKLFCIWRRKEFYRVSGRVYCDTLNDVLEAGKEIDKAFRGEGVYPFTLLADTDADDIQIVKVKGKWKEGVLRYSFTRGWYAVSKEDWNKHEYQ